MEAADTRGRGAMSTRPARSARQPTQLMSESTKGMLFVLPALALLVVVLGFPLIGAMLQSVNLMWVDHPHFSLVPFRTLARDPAFGHALLITFYYVVCSVAFHLVTGICVALPLNRDLPFKWVFRVAALLPWTMPDAVAGMVWRFMLDPLSGFINSLLLALHVIVQPIDWLGTPHSAFASVVISEGWRAYPFVMLLLLAGLQAIPRTQYEAAEIDGANRWQCFIHVTLPNLRTMLVIALVLDTISQCRVFGLIYTLTNGGPGDATTVLPILTYQENFQFFNTAYAAAMALTLAAITFIVSLPYLRLTMRQRA